MGILRKFRRDFVFLVTFCKIEIRSSFPAFLIRSSYQFRQSLSESCLRLFDVHCPARLNDELHDLLAEMTPAVEHGAYAFAACPFRRGSGHLPNLRSARAIFP